MTTKLSVVGSPISHSLSPILHSAAYSFLGIDFLYEKNEVTKGNLASFAGSSGFQALSVTMPLKQEAYALSTIKSESARLTQVVNSLVLEHGKWIGDNTDVFGLSKVLGTVTNKDKIHLIGSGATTRSALLAISISSPTSGLTISARNQNALEDVLEFADSLGLALRPKDLSIDTALESTLLMSFVPTGSLEEFWNDLLNSGHTPGGMFFDVSYKPWPSKAAEAWGETSSISGLEMLVWQAVAQVRFFVQHLQGGVTFQDEELYSAMLSAVLDL